MNLSQNIGTFWTKFLNIRSFLHAHTHTHTHCHTHICIHMHTKATCSTVFVVIYEKCEKIWRKSCHGGTLALHSLHNSTRVCIVEVWRTKIPRAFQSWQNETMIVKHSGLYATEVETEVAENMTEVLKNHRPAFFLSKISLKGKINYLSLVSPFTIKKNHFLNFVQLVIF